MKHQPNSGPTDVNSIKEIRVMLKSIYTVVDWETHVYWVKTHFCVFQFPYWNSCYLFMNKRFSTYQRKRRVMVTGYSYSEWENGLFELNSYWSYIFFFEKRNYLFFWHKQEVIVKKNLFYMRINFSDIDTNSNW